MRAPARYHPGEVTAQQRAGLVEQAELSRGGIGTAVPPPAVAFLDEQPVLFVGAADAHGQMWASLLTGNPGFVRVQDRNTGLPGVPDGSTLHVAARPVQADPLAAALAQPAQIGTLAIEPATRRRMRLNGRSRPTPAGLSISAEQVYANCPKYIQQRTPHPAPHRATPAVGTVTAALDGAQRSLLAGADTFFVATRSADGDADVSHRGGRPGFVQVLGGTELRWPDYVGNAMMMTLGNLQQDRAAGLLFLDWRTGTTVQLTGTAIVDWDPARAADLPGAQRAVHYHITQVVQIEHASPLAWTAPVFSKHNPPTPTSQRTPGQAAAEPAERRGGRS